MRTRIITIPMLCCMVASQALGADRPRVGVYDSRAVAVAYGASEMRKSHKTPSDLARATAEQELAAARAAGAQKRMAELKAELLRLRKHQAQLAFGTAPVNDILHLIRDRIPWIKEAANVEFLVSKWNSAELARHKSAELVDVTLLLVAEFDPSKMTLQSVWGLQQTEPVSLDGTGQAVEKGI